MALFSRSNNTPMIFDFRRQQQSPSFWHIASRRLLRTGDEKNSPRMKRVFLTG
jgi:hypothetical protein